MYSPSATITNRPLAQNPQFDIFSPTIQTGRGNGRSPTPRPARRIHPAQVPNLASPLFFLPNSTATTLLRSCPSLPHVARRTGQENKFGKAMRRNRNRNTEMHGLGLEGGRIKTGSPCRTAAAVLLLPGLGHSRRRKRMGRDETAMRGRGMGSRSTVVVVIDVCTLDGQTLSLGVFFCFAVAS
ncbi:uncharacterized protein K460DRAFT_18309 [Cucurbitaria berberidis CBS 394.84]|uniref:Uncharacterized protein n=1 Tax=Cucurbitaria berberidis CBS 394.84 TaxID=1168544 RepID=A0A9P4LD23_9PLEO|nr:uncharacterized protein K460DRAFT_18309 [Cucurbitaria berberidis CBS 394.84]KAF1850610.1 hypothetical protein K460DRAFT_18309 [Cucurbitaria berberidis CBS 394.84]